MLKELEPTIGSAGPKSGFTKIGAAAQLTHLLTSDVIAAIRVRPLQMLANQLSPKVIAPLLAPLKDNETDRALEVLRAQEGEMDFFTALGEVATMMTEEGVELLREQGIVLDGTVLGELIVTAYLRKRDAFRRAHARRLAEDVAAGSFYFRRPAHLPADLSPREITPALLEEARKKCIRHYEGRNCGPTVLIQTLLSESRTGVYITHGGIRSGHAAINRKEERVPRFDRPEKTDVVFFDRDTNLAWVRALRGNTDFCASVLGFLLFGDERVYAAPVNFDLTFAKAQDISARLLGVAGGGISAVSIRHRTIDDLPTGKLEQPAGRHECVTTKYPALDGTSRELGIVTLVKLAIELEDSKMGGGTITVKPGSIGLPKTLPDSISMKVLSGLGILRPYGH